MRRDLKIMWSSNSPNSNSGYATFTKDWIKRVKEDKWPLSIISWAGMEGGTPIEIQGVLSYPRMASAWGEDAMVNHGRHFQADVNFAMQDLWPLEPQFLAQLPCFIPYVPIDKFPVPQPVLDRLKYAYKIITFSKFGQESLQKSGFASTLIPEGTDTSVFKPLDKQACRKEIGLPADKFIFGMIGANKPDAIVRKSWQQALEAFKMFHDKHSESLFFYESNQMGGFPIEEYADFLGIRANIVTVNPYMSIYHGSSEIVNKWLNCFDVTLHPSSTEGFGLVIIESQSAGTPVIVNRLHSMPELVKEGVTGEICEPVKRGQWVAGGGFIHYPDVDSLYEKMEKMYERVNKEENKITTDCRNWILENYSIDKLFKDKWLPFLERLQEERKPAVVDEKSKKV